jgi:crossover junction endodeoxyribonuclease RuvC
MIYIGIDPGANGGLVSLDDEDVVLYSMKYNIKDYVSYFKNICKHSLDVVVFVEKVHAMPRQGVRSMFTFGQRFGEIMGLLEAFQMEFYLIEPQRWKKHFSLIGSNKKDSCIKALELEPTLECKGKRGGLIDGICDAYLIALYGKETLCQT